MCLCSYGFNSPEDEVLSLVVWGLGWKLSACRPTAHPHGHGPELQYGFVRFIHSGSWSEERPQTHCTIYCPTH